MGSSDPLGCSRCAASAPCSTQVLLAPESLRWTAYPVSASGSVFDVPPALGRAEDVVERPVPGGPCLGPQWRPVAFRRATIQSVGWSTLPFWVATFVLRAGKLANADVAQRRVPFGVKDRVFGLSWGLAARRGATAGSCRPGPRLGQGRPRCARTATAGTIQGSALWGR